MKFALSMMRDYVETGLNAEQIGELLTMAGFELEGIEQVEGEDVLDIKVVSNRGDGLSILGLAREILAKDLGSQPTDLYNRAVAGFEDVNPPESLALDPEAAAIESDQCRRFAVRRFEGVDARAAAPEWIQKRLRVAGHRPLSLLVDLTNYVMLELGQPLHAFDAERLAGRRIVVRHARPGETLTTLNGEEHELSGQMMICDAERPVGVPGVMGGLETEVTDSTRSVLLESANFVNHTVRATRKALGLSTEASYRFERSVDPEGVVRAARRFTELLLQAQPEVICSPILDLYPLPPTLAPVRLRVDRASMLLGMEIEPELARTYLLRLGMKVDQAGSVLTVIPPSWRPDIVREEDLVEELGRVHGYERIPEALPSGGTPLGGATGRYLILDKMREALLRCGFHQILSHSLRSAHPLDEPCERVAPRNPASPDHNVLRSSLLPGLAEAFLRNGAYGLHLFEIGKVFYARRGELGETTYLSLMSQGPVLTPARKGEPVINSDFYSVKGVLESVLDVAGIRGGVEVDALPGDQAGEMRYHPTRSAVLKAGGEVVGTFGQIHPEAARATDLHPNTFMAEIAVDRLIDSTQGKLDVKPLSRNPAVSRDIAILIAKSVPYAKIEQAIRRSAGEVLESVELFDVFTGQGVPEGSHSLGIAMAFRKFGENFTDSEANQVRDAIVGELEQLGAKLR